MVTDAIKTICDEPACNSYRNKDEYCWFHYFNLKRKCKHGYEDGDACNRDVEDNSLDICDEHWPVVKEEIHRLNIRRIKKEKTVLKIIGVTIAVCFISYVVLPTSLIMPIALVVGCYKTWESYRESEKSKSEFGKYRADYGGEDYFRYE